MTYHDAHEQASDPKYAYLWHSSVNDYMGAGKRRPGRPKGSTSQDKIDSAFQEVYAKVPANVIKTGKTGKPKRAMMTAIALSKARKAGARIPKI